MNSDLSAQVVFKTADGRSLSQVGPITSATIERIQPDPSAVARAAAYFRKADFDVGPRVGLSLSITGPPSLFEAIFGDMPRVEGQAVTASSGELELSIDALPADVAAAIDAVTFTRPPEFGPTSFA